MILDLREIFSSKISSKKINETLDFSNLELNGVQPIISPVVFDGEVTNRADVVSLKGNAEFTYSAPCDRCAEVTERQFSIPVKHIIVNSLSNEDEEEFIVSENMEIDLYEIIRTDIVLGIPYTYLCKDDCKGVCAGCGKNLNYEDCICEKEVDPRLAKLSEFFD